MATASNRNRPGVAIEQFSPPPALDFRTGVAGFLGPAIPVGTPPARLPDPWQPGASDPQQPFTSWHDFTAAFCGDKGWLANRWVPDQLLWSAVQGYFQNGGTRCWVVFYDLRTGDTSAALEAAVATLAQIDDVDLVCAPSLMARADTALALQQQLIRSFELVGDGGPRRNDWFLLLDPPDIAPSEIATKLPVQLTALRGAPSNHPENIAIYYPWVQLGGDVEPPPVLPDAKPDAKPLQRVPPSGHVAGIFARTDQEVGVFKAPANASIEGIVDVVDVVDVEAANPLRAFPGRGIRVWGARTLATGPAAGASQYVNVRRLVLTLERWLVRALDWVVFEANDFRLWVRINRELNAKLGALFLQGAFAGTTPDEAFRVKCDANNNPDDVRASGKLQIDIQIAPLVPKEFIQIRVVRSAEGLTVT
jgi:hypothetical protein